MAETAERKADSQVPLDTIPISPAKENVDPNSTSDDGAMNGAAKSGDEQITVFHDKDNFNVKHPLMHEWTLWFTKPPSGKVHSMLGRRCPAPDGEAERSLGRQLERSSQRSCHFRLRRRVLGRLRKFLRGAFPVFSDMH